MKKIFALALCMLIVCMASITIAESVGGTDGKVFWAYDSQTKTLTIFGQGEMADFGAASIVPWDLYANEIKSVVIERGVESIGRNAFKKFTELISVSIAEGVEKIGESAFWDCPSLRSITLPSTVTQIGIGAFRKCEKLETMIYRGTVEPETKGFWNDNTKLTHVQVPAGYGSDTFGDVPAVTYYDIHIHSGAHGTVSAVDFAIPYTNVTLTVTPDAHYLLGELTVTDEHGEAVAVSGPDSEGKYSFTMPESNAAVTATFIPQPDLPKTGDQSSLALWLAMLAMAGTAVLALQGKTD